MYTDKIEWDLNAAESDQRASIQIIISRYHMINNHESKLILTSLTTFTLFTKSPGESESSSPCNMTNKSPNGGKNASSGASLETGRAILCLLYNLDLMGNCYGKNYGSAPHAMVCSSQLGTEDDIGEVESQSVNHEV